MLGGDAGPELKEGYENQAPKRDFSYPSLLTWIFLEIWGGRIRTFGSRNQNPVTYHLSTPQSRTFYLIRADWQEFF